MTILALIKRFWKELLLIALAIAAYLGWSRKPEVREVTKIEYVDRVVTVEKIVTVEKTSITNKKKRTTIEKPDGTKVVTETTEEKNTDTKIKKDEKKDTKETIKTETSITINRNQYNLNLSYSLYGEETVSSSINIRLGQLPILAGPHVIYNLETKKYGLGLNIQIEI
jgi:hypothetical protein